MRKISKAAKKVLESLVAKADAGGGHVTIDNTDGTFMPVSVERLGKAVVSVTHYFEQNGDLVPDPDMTFWQGPDSEWYPCTIQHAFRARIEAVRFGSEGTPTHVNLRGQRDMAVFAATWMKNIRCQQFGR